MYCYFDEDEDEEDVDSDEEFSSRQTLYEDRSG